MDQGPRPVHDPLIAVSPGGGFRPGSQGSGTLSAISNLSNKKVRDLRNGKFIDFWGDWNPVTFLMTGFQNKTDSLSFFVSQLGCFIDLKINTSTRRCGRVGVKMK